MSKDSIFAGVELIPRDQVRGWTGWLLRDVPAAGEWRATVDRWLENDNDAVRHEYRQRLLSNDNGKAAYND